MLAMSKQSQVSLNRMAALVQGIKHKHEDARTDDEESAADQLKDMVKPAEEAFARLVAPATIHLNGDFPTIPYMAKSAEHRPL